MADNDAMKLWWVPVAEMQFDDPRQAPPRYHYPNNVRTYLPAKGFWLTAYREASVKCGVFLGRGGDGGRHWPQRVTEMESLLAELPPETRIEPGKHGLSWHTEIPRSRFRGDDDAEREWLKSILNRYVDVLRPRLS